MHSRCSLVFGACAFLLAVGGSVAETTSSETVLASYQDWAGYANQTVTRDGSVLSEYIAQTSSVNTQNAVLSISMIPRFACLPVTSILVNDSTLVPLLAGAKLLLTADEQTNDFPFIVDENESGARFTLRLAGKEQKKLRSILDLATWSTLNWAVEPTVSEPRLSHSAAEEDAPTVSEQGIDFSLLGSQRTVKHMEDMCKSHVPEPLTN